MSFLGGLSKDRDTILWFIILFLLIFYCNCDNYYGTTSTAEIDVVNE